MKAEKRQFSEALIDADLAARRIPPLHEILANRTDILIELGKFAEADEQLKNIEQAFRSKSARTVNAGLRCKYFFRQGDWKSAELAFANIATPDAAVHQMLLSEILRQKSIDPTLTHDERAQTLQQLADLTPTLTSINEALSLLVSRHLDEDDSTNTGD